MPNSLLLEPNPDTASRSADATVILAVAASDVHVVANQIIAAQLRRRGYEVINLGAATPTQEIIECWQMHRDAIAIAIGSLNGHAAQDLDGLATLKQLYQVTCPVIVGGNLSVGSAKDGSEAETLKALGVDLILEDANALFSVLEKLRPNPDEIPSNVAGNDVSAADVAA